MAFRVLTGLFGHESNAFSKLPTRLENFSNYLLAFGDDVPGAIKGATIEPTGVEEAAEYMDWDLVRTVVAWATPSGPVARDAWDVGTAAILDAAANQGPFDGVLGFSQGASAAALALALVPSLRETVAFAILFSGFAPLDPTASAALFGPRDDGGGGGGGGGDTLRGVRSLHVWGTADGMVSRERFEELRSAFRTPEPETFEHDGGHGVPFSKEFRAALKAFALAA